MGGNGIALILMLVGFVIAFIVPIVALTALF
jgi:hypothetical protein